MTILILGAAGHIGKLLTKDISEQTDYTLVLFARDATKRITIKDPRVKIIDGYFKDKAALEVAMQGVDAIYLNDMNDAQGVATIVETMKKQNVKRIIAASILGIYDEVPGKFGKWNERMVGAERIKAHARNAALVEVPELDYTILRLTWLYNEKGNTKYSLTQKGEPFIGTEVTREAVAQLIVDILEDTSQKYIQKSIGVSEPDTDGDKPSFY
jgi:uncharacterized protein YbjT (DUF2867 family)